MRHISKTGPHLHKVANNRALVRCDTHRTLCIIMWSEISKPNLNL